MLNPFSRGQQRRYRPSVNRLEDRTVPSMMWADAGVNPQHTGISPWAAQPLDAIHWQAPVDLNNTGAFIHYGAPVVTAKDTVIVPVKTGQYGGFELVAHDGATGAVKWTLTTDYTLPPYSWMPPFGPALTPAGALVFAGNNGTIYVVDHPDQVNATISRQLAFYNATDYQDYSDIQIDTPITADAAGNVYFGFVASGSNPQHIARGGLARIDASGHGSWVQANRAAHDNQIMKVAYACAPALSLDGSTLYVAVNSDIMQHGYLLALDSTTLATKSRVFLTDPRDATSPADILDISTATPMVAPDGSVFYGIMGNPFNGSRGFLLHFSSNLKQEYTPGAFGWDDTPSVVPTSMVPQYHGTAPYLIFAKYNNYAGDGNGVNEIAILDPFATQPDTRNDGDPTLLVMNEVLTMAGPTPDTDYRPYYPDAVREWCINDTAVDPRTDSILVNSEDGNIYRWNIASNTLSQGVLATMGIGQPYTSTVIGTDGTIYAINGGTIFAMGGYQQYAIHETASANPAVVGQSITFTTSLRSKIGGPVPTGTVTYVDVVGMDMTTLQTVELTNGVAVCKTSSMSLGSHLILAEYSGDSNYPAGQTLLVESVRYGSSTSLTASVNPTVYGQYVTLTATVSAAGGSTDAPTGKVTFMDGSVMLGSVDLQNGQASLTVNTLPAGMDPITAQYSGDIHFVPTSAAFTQTVNQAGTVTHLTSSPNPSQPGQRVTFTATVHALGAYRAIPDGMVEFVLGSKVLAIKPLVDGQAMFTTSRLPQGNDKIQAFYLGTADFRASHSVVYHQIVGAPDAAGQSSFAQADQLFATLADDLGNGPARPLPRLRALTESCI